jgi:hypothetical protein
LYPFTHRPIKIISFSDPSSCSLSHSLSKAIALVVATIMVTTFTMIATASAEEPSKEAMQSLDEQVQEIKSDVLAIAAELNNLEEKLLYPSNSQVAIFVSLEEGDALGLDSVQLSIDGELVAHHIYSFKELAALQKGGIQRIYAGNVRTGKHQLDVSIAATASGGRDIEQRQSFSFTKEVDSKLVGITLASKVTGDATIAVGSW